MTRTLSVARGTVFRETLPAPLPAMLDEVILSLPARDGSDDPRARCIAVVHTADEIRFSVTSNGREQLVALLAEYVAGHAADRLWPRDAERVRSLLACGEQDAAIASYFAAVGQRWDKEWLVTTVVRADE